MAAKEILLLGNEKLYNKSEVIKEEELKDIKYIVEDLHDTMMNFREKYNCGRAIAAPQIGVFKRLIYMNVDKPYIFINPTLQFIGDETMVVIDDCMSFPGLLVKVNRYKKCNIHYKDMEWKDCVLELEDDLSELIQHEYDHLDGILAVMRAIDNKSFSVKNS
ncbi:peptide deformylase [Clostridium grantii]|uniref:Peptide deformylase n=1 Tax=Clostridium grantii DSM 8605 TaxID=1121316 RepID=A0A1M5X656_9CLOT|nr:peptide deformylase [Clostridium grantii]SHH94693.1 peptide deformylase [Clostridium grantii DSM 8605]